MLSDDRSFGIQLVREAREKTPSSMNTCDTETRPGEKVDDLTNRTRVSLLALATAFLTVSLLGFGGGIIWARRIAVERRGWITEAEFVDIVSLTQFMPGPNILGIAVCVGARLRGIAGAVAAVAGFLVIPWSVGLSLGVMCLNYAHTPLVRNVLGGVSAAAAGMLIATGIKLLLPHRRRPAGIIIACVAVVLMAFTRLPLLAVLTGLAPFSIAIAGFREPRVS
jgi:chromate transporter